MFKYMLYKKCNLIYAIFANNAIYMYIYIALLL